jgi:hypothetical protein
VDSEKPKFETWFLFNEKMVHLVDDIFWHLGFRSAEHADKVTYQKTFRVIILIIALILAYFRFALKIAFLRAYGLPNAKTSPKICMTWVLVTVRYCVTAGSATSTKKMLRVEGKPIGVSMLALHRSE